MRIKQTLGAIVLAGAIGLTGCSMKTETPYKPIPMSESQKSVGQKVIVEGLPSLIRDEGFVIRDGKNELYVSRNFYEKNKTIGDYVSAEKALNKEMSDSDEEKVKVYGIMEKDNTIEARFVDIEGTLYPIYK